VAVEEKPVAKKIGELLVDQGLITRAQLSRTLQSQLISGGHLGTCLVELGYASIDSVGETLADALKMRYARPEMLCGIPAWVIDTLSAELVEKFQVIPIGKEDRSLHLAVISPGRLSSLSMHTGYKIIPWISPEIRILEAMERYYDIPRRPRYLKLSHTADSRLSSMPESSSSAHGRWAPTMSPTDEAAIHRSKKAPALAHNSSGNSLGFSGHRPRPVAVSTLPNPTGAAVAVATNSIEAPAPAPGPAAERRLEEVARQMSHAEDREELASVVISHAARHVSRCILFGVKGESAYVWDWSGIDLNPTHVSGLELPVIEGSVFDLLQGDSSYWGPVPKEAKYDAFYGPLESAAPDEVLLLPIYLHDRLVAVLYGEGDASSPIGGEIEAWSRLVSKISMALNMIVLKMKIRGA
jgi:hypothetical protein